MQSRGQGGPGGRAAPLSQQPCLRPEVLGSCSPLPFRLGEHFARWPVGVLPPHERDGLVLDDRLGFGRIVASEIEAPNMLAILV
jgi:hypothetical protein